MTEKKNIIEQKTQNDCIKKTHKLPEIKLPHIQLCQTRYFHKIQQLNKLNKC